MRLGNHLRRLQHQFGKPLKLGQKSFRARGYHADRLATDFEHEAKILTVLGRLLHGHEGAFVDIGAQAGQTLLKMISLDPARQYIGFEPQVDCCFYIDRFITDNRLTNASILPVALSDGEGMLKLYVTDYKEMATTLPGGAGQFKWVPGRVGDDVLGEMGLSTIAAIKIDVGGTELEVLRGLGESMKKWSPLLILEVPPNFTGEERTMLPAEMQQTNNRRSSEIAKLLSDRGYTLYQLDRQGQEIEIQAFNLDDPKNYIGRDYVARPARDRSAVQ